MALLLGIDVGTSSTKEIVIDDSGRVVVTAASPHTLDQPHPGWSEQNPDQWWAATIAATREVTGRLGRRASEIAAVGMSGQMHGSVLLPRESLDGSGERAKPLRPAILWNDQRTAAQCDFIERAAGTRRRLVEMVGNAALPGFTLPKLLWLRENEPESWRRTAMVLLPKDYVRLRLTGLAATDVGDGAGTLLLDVDRRTWNIEAMRLFDIDPTLLPPVLESAAPAGTVTAWAAAQTGLPAGIPVAAGSGDNQCGAVGAGVVEAGVALATLGTSGVLYAHANSPRRDLGPDERSVGRIHTMCASDGHVARTGQWCLTGCMLSAGGSLQWVRDRLFPGESVESLIADAANAPPGCEGLVFLPHLTGERCPHPDPLARGAWVGLTSRHSRAHLVRSVLEGVTFTMRSILDIFIEAGIDASTVRLGGGGARSKFWRQMQADIYARPVCLPNTEEGPALGAALLGGVAAGVWESVPAACRACIHITETHDPDVAAADRYEPVRRVYDSLYPSLRETFHALALGH
ncbi:MAG: xylulokinase [Phycisphaeraceae bacterium]|nr:xylulokinase [Phycisphaeraceae bacterium]